MAERLTQRYRHFFHRACLGSQLAVLEEPTADEHPITVPIGRSVKEEVAEILATLGQ